MTTHVLSGHWSVNTLTVCRLPHAHCSNIFDICDLKTRVNMTISNTYYQGHWSVNTLITVVDYPHYRGPLLHHLSVI